MKLKKVNFCSLALLVPELSSWSADSDLVGNPNAHPGFAVKIDHPGLGFEL